MATSLTPHPLKILKRDGALIFESKEKSYRADATDDDNARLGAKATLFAFDLRVFQASIALPIGEARAGKGDRLLGRRPLLLLLTSKKQTDQKKNFE